MVQRKNIKEKKKSLANNIEDRLAYQIDTTASALDPSKFSEEWSGPEEGASSLIYAHEVLPFVSQAKQLAPDNVSVFASEGLGLFSSLLTHIDALEKLRNLPNTTRHAKEKVANVLFNVVMSDYSNLSNLFSVLVAAGVLHGAAVGILTPIGTVGVAAGAWGAVAFSSISLLRATRYYYSSSYWFKDKLIRYKKIKKKIARLEDEINNLQQEENKTDDNKKLESIRNKIKIKQLRIRHWIVAQEKSKQQAIAIAQVNNKKGKPLSSKLTDRFATLVEEEVKESIENKPYRKLSDKEFRRMLQEQPTKDTEKLIKELKKNQRDVIISRAITTVSLTIMATGLTLLAVSPFCAHGAPVVFAVGLALVLLGSAIQLGKFLSTRIVNAVATKHQYKQERETLRKEYISLLGNKELQDLDDATKLKYRLSFEYSQHHEASESACYKALQDMDEKKRKRILNAAEKKAMNHRILCRALDVKPDSEILNQLSDKAKQKIINRECRSTLTHSMTTSVATFFKKHFGRKTKEEETPSDAEGDEPHNLH